MVNTIQSDLIYLWSDCPGHGWKASLGLTRFISSGTAPHECSYTLSRASSALERVHLLLWEPSWLHPEAAQVFQHHIPTTRSAGRWKGAETPSTESAWIKLGFWDPALCQLCQAQMPPQLLHLLCSAPGPVGLNRPGTAGPAPQPRSHSLSVPAALGNRLWARSREIKWLCGVGVVDVMRN